MTAAVQAGDAGGVLQDAAAILRFGGDDLANPALLHQRLAARARRGIGEQELHVPGAHIPAVDLVDRAGLALNAPGDLEHIRVVELGRGSAGAVVETDRHLGHIAARAYVGAGEDNVVHRPAAHILVGGLAHHPAQGFEQIGFAAAIRPDDARQPWLDQQLGRLDKGFETQ